MNAVPQSDEVNKASTSIKPEEPEESETEIITTPNVVVSGIPYVITCNMKINGLTQEEWNYEQETKFIDDMSKILGVQKSSIDILSPKTDKMNQIQDPEDIFESFQINLPVDIQFQINNVDSSVVITKENILKNIKGLPSFPGNTVEVTDIISQNQRDTIILPSVIPLEEQKNEGDAQAQQNEDDKEKALRAYNPKIQRELLINDSESLLGMFSKLSDAEKLCGEISDRQEKIDLKEENKILKKAKIQLDEQQSRIVELNEILSKLRKDKIKNELVNKKCQSNNQKLINNDYNIVKKLASSNLLRDQSTKVNLNVSDSLKALLQTLEQGSGSGSGSGSSTTGTESYNNGCEPCGFKCDNNIEPMAILGKGCCECPDDPSSPSCPSGYSGNFLNRQIGCLPEEFKECLEHPVGSLERAKCIVRNGGGNFGQNSNLTSPFLPPDAFPPGYGHPSKYGAVNSDLVESETQDRDWYQICGIDESKYIDLDELRHGICHGCDYETLKKNKVKITSDFQ